MITHCKNILNLHLLAPRCGLGNRSHKNERMTKDPSERCACGIDQNKQTLHEAPRFQLVQDLPRPLTRMWI
jgi:hypothetical protein